MIDILPGLNEEKRNRIINAALTEFVSRGYEKASTNSICKTAGISKGSLFQYFGSKKSLFLQLFDYSCALMSQCIIERIDPGCPDILKRLEIMYHSSAEILDLFPLILDFKKIAKKDMDPDISADIESREVQTEEALNELLIQDIDYGLFQEGLDCKLAVFTIQSALQNKVSQYLFREDLDIQQALDDIDELIRFFRITFYRT